MDVKSKLIEGLQSDVKYLPVWYRYDKDGSLFNDRCLSDNKYYYFYQSEINVISKYVEVSIYSFLLFFFQRFRFFIVCTKLDVLFFIVHVSALRVPFFGLFSAK